MEFSFLDFDEAGGDFESGEDDVEVVRLVFFRPEDLEAFRKNSVLPV